MLERRYCNSSDVLGVGTVETRQTEQAGECDGKCRMHGSLPSKCAGIAGAVFGEWNAHPKNGLFVKFFTYRYGTVTQFTAN
jgi:hypothetical protein